MGLTVFSVSLFNSEVRVTWQNYGFVEQNEWDYFLMVLQEFVLI